MMTKESIGRYDVKCNLLKRVIIRLDYQGMTSVEQWIGQLKPKYRKLFISCSRSYLTTSQMNNARLREVQEGQGIPERNFLSEPLFTFNDGKLDGHEDTLTIGVSCYFTIITIECKNYTNIDDYFSIVKDYIEMLLRFDNYITIKRFGIRKIGGGEFETTKDIFNVFEEFIMFANPVDESVSYVGQNYKDFLYRKDKGILVNFVRQCREVSKSNRPLLQVLVDIDAYMTEEELVGKEMAFPKDTDRIFKNINDYLFFLFKRSIKETYLYGHY